MMKGFLLTRRNMLLSLVGMVMTTMLALYGCGGGSSSYDSPTAQITTTVTQSGNALVSAEELKAWIDEGKVNAPLGSYDRVVILDVTSSATYAAGHIPGAQFVDGTAPFMANRAEGPFTITGNMVCNGATMDALIQKHGIDANTTIVLTGSSTINVSRPYATFRYWGFPKNRLKVLQGGNAAWTTATYALSTDTPVIAQSTYCVTPNSIPLINADMRVSLPEMITYVKSIVAGNPENVIVLDTIRGTTQVTSTTDLLETGYTPMEGAIKGSYRFPYGGVVTSGLYFKDAATLKSDISAGTDYLSVVMGDTKRDSAKTFIVQCRAGNAASVAYFALDGIAYYDNEVDIKWYDGSYGQWNLLVGKDKVGTSTVNAGGQLKIGSVWETTTLMDNLTYTVDITPARTVVTYGARVYAVEPALTAGNQLEDEDKAYRSATTSTSGGGGASAGGGC